MVAPQEIALKLISAYLAINELGLSAQRTRDKFAAVAANDPLAASGTQSAEEFEKKFMGVDETTSAEIKKWLVKASSSNESTYDQLAKDVNDHLADKTYLVGDGLTAADITVSASDTKRAELNSFTRWFDLVQHSVSESTLNDVGFKIVSIDTSVKPARTQPSSTSAEAKPTKDENTDKAGKKEKAAKPKKEKPAKKQPAPKESVPIIPSMIDLRVGRIVGIERHPDADSLYVEQIDLGEEGGPRTVVSGLVNYIPIEEMKDRMVIAVCNLKPAKMRGIESRAMVLCASLTEPNATSASKVELVEPPAGSKPGDRAYFDGYNNDPEPLLNPKKKIWEAIQPGFITNERFEGGWTDAAGQFKPLLVNGTPCKCTSIVKGAMK
ncbi:hypothetical protein BB560_007220 [Smittium megazygosporum]|uniref:tRNA-binding domain-containing protein n=1 Tax=Smittium megazygosporum TaxID=133381 RepID=A0A2T9XXV4_9FUNG|nr:hypothetical protein BB560_007220 [Smittium megazygosporum]